MSSEPGESELPETFAWVSGKVPFGNEDEALETLASFKELEFGGMFGEPKTKLDSEDADEGISIQFSNEENVSNLHFRLGPEGNLRFRLGLAENDLQNLIPVLDKIMENSGEIELVETGVNNHYEINFEDLDIPIGETELEIRGVRIRHEGNDYIIQGTEPGLSVTMVNREDQVHGDTSEDYLDNQINTMNHLIREVL